MKHKPFLLLVMIGIILLGGCGDNIDISYVDFENPLDITNLIERKIDEIRVRHSEVYQPLMFKYKGKIADPWWNYVEGYSTPKYICIRRTKNIKGDEKTSSLSKVMFHCTLFYKEN